MTHKITAAGVAAVGVAALAFTTVPGTAQAHNTGAAPAAAKSVAFTTTAFDTHVQQSQVTRQYWTAHHRGWVQAKAEAAARAKARAEAAARAEARAKARAAEARTAARRAAVRRAAARRAAAIDAVPVSDTVYANNLNGWINHALAIMRAHGIPGTYNGIYRNTMRESSGNPNAINLWDSNAAAGTPSKGLLQTIQPTFNTYHVAGTSWNIYDPVANLVAACNYAYHVYGSIDNVNGAY